MVVVLLSTVCNGFKQLPEVCRKCTKPEKEWSGCRADNATCYFENKNSTIERVSQAGFDDSAILEATLVIACFNFMNRIVLALGVDAEEKTRKG
jgi:hypothetical protein